MNESYNKIFNTLIKNEFYDLANNLITALLSHKDRILYAIYAAEQAIGFYESQYPGDNRIRSLLDTVKSSSVSNLQDALYAGAAAGDAAIKAADIKEAAETDDSLDALSYAADAAVDAAYAVIHAYNTASIPDSINAASYAAKSARMAATSNGSEMWLKILNYGIGLYIQSEPSK